MLYLKTDVATDYETSQQHNVTLQAKDTGGLYIDQSFTINVLNDPGDDEQPTYNNLGSSKSVYLYGVSISSPDFADENNRDLFGILVVDETGSFIGDEVHLTSQIGNEYIQI